MKTSKELIYEYIQKETYTNNDFTSGIDTKNVALALNMQRSNVSAVLNELVQEGKLEKSDSRPVLYSITKQTGASAYYSTFEKLVGFDGSLKNAVQLAKAAILYPKKSLNVLLMSQRGTGTSYFARLMYEFAIERGILQSNAPFIRINCKHFIKTPELLTDEIFGYNDDLSKSSFAKAQNGVLFIDNFDILDGKQQSRLFEFIDTGRVSNSDLSEVQVFDDIVLIIASPTLTGNDINQKIPMTIELPNLSERSIEERFELVNHFFTIEATNSDRNIIVERDIVCALIAHEFEYNIKEMEIEIISACANAYVRVVNEQDEDVYVYLSDFKQEIRKSLLIARGESLEINQLIGDEPSLSYDKKVGLLLNNHRKDDMYAEIRKQYDELSNRGINTESIEDIINEHVSNLSRQYRYYLQSDDKNQVDQLSKIVDSRVISKVSAFIDLCSQELKRTFKSNVFYGLCLHINSLLSTDTKMKRVDDTRIVDIIQNYPKEYALSIQFAEKLKRSLDIDLPIEEVVLITMFIIENDEDKSEGNPVLLYIMHGSSTASSLKEVTNALTHSNNAHSYDLELSTDTSEALEDIRNLILKIDEGQGVLVLYDMGSIKTMLDTLSEELPIKIRTINIPITLMGIDIARRCSMETDIDYVLHMTNLSFSKYAKNEERQNEVIITLCHTGEGGALQLKDYIDNSSLLDMKTIPLAISNREELILRVTEIRKVYKIHAFVGTYDPKLFGIPFISISKIFETRKEFLDRILMFQPVNSTNFDYEQIYEHLEEQLRYVSVPKLKTTLPEIVDQLSILYPLTEDQRLGLFIHLASLLERLLEGIHPHINKDRDKIINMFEEDYEVISRHMRDLEKRFKVMIDDNEIATIIMMLKKI
ncbi:PRD domain-containing protein [Erysipelothrix sp. HDW6A]|uniref:PRD domain-containing protein n=1 Tax=Erysipelothrix sp. HDW6A TaxID=2714928 RepID=UPI00140E5A3B|nr:PRD domain-containing protein [Erysipelothrix sp. HDW6A]QIK57935.1 PRD domain-containing protein [Erysipelothrix sp. HDW6A]